MRLGEARSVAENAFNTRDIGATGLGVKDQAGKNARPGAAALHRGDEDTMGGLVSARMDGQDRCVAEAATEGGEKRVEAIGAEDDDEAAFRLEGGRSGAKPGVKAALREYVRRRARDVG